MIKAQRYACEKSWKQGNPLSNTIKDTSTIMRNPSLHNSGKGLRMIVLVSLIVLLRGFPLTVQLVNCSCISILSRPLFCWLTSMCLLLHSSQRVKDQLNRQVSSLLTMNCVDLLLVLKKAMISLQLDSMPSGCRNITLVC